MDFSTISYILFSSIQVGLIYTLISLGFNLLYSSTRIINAAYGDVLVIGAYGAFWLFTILHVSPPISLIIIIPIVAALGCVMYITLFDDLLQLKSVETIEIWGVILTFGLSMTLQGLMSLMWTPQSRAYSYMDNVLAFGGITFMANKLVVMVAAGLAVFALYLLLFKTDTGISMRSVIQDPELAELLGVSLRRIFVVAFIISCVTGGFAGVLISMTTDINPFVGGTYLIIAFVVTAVGGLGNPVGSLVGGLLIGLVNVIVGYVLGPSLSMFVLYMILIGILLTRPAGLLGRKIA